MSTVKTETLSIPNNLWKILDIAPKSPKSFFGRVKNGNLLMIHEYDGKPIDNIPYVPNYSIDEMRKDIEYKDTLNFWCVCLPKNSLLKVSKKMQDKIDELYIEYFIVVNGSNHYESGSFFCRGKDNPFLVEIS